MARAYVVYTDDSGIYVLSWDPGVIPIQIKLPTSPTLLDGTNYASSVQAAMQAWNAQLGTVQFTAQVINTPMNPPAGTYSTSSSDTHNEIVMDSSYNGNAFDSQTLAITTTFSRGDSLVQADMVINTAWTWDSYRGNLLSGKQDIRRVVIHELGHVLGLKHPDQAAPPQTVTAIMNSRVSNIDTMQADDIAGVQLLYAAPGFVPANNDFANATPISLSSSSIQLTGTNIAATRQSGEPNHAGANATNGHSVWWRWTAPGSGSTTITTLGSNFDTVLAVYTGSAVNALTTVASNDDVTGGVVRTSTVTFSAVGGTTYSIAVDGWGSTSEGDQNTPSGAITLNLTFAGSLSAAPAITTQPAGQTVTAGAPVTFAAVVTGNPVPAFQWSKGGVAITGATNASYTIASTTLADAGSYTLVATNSLGSATSNAATLTVNPATVAPAITTQPASQLVNVGNSAIFTAVASGNPSPTYQWQKNSVNISGATGNSLTLSNVTSGDAGSYRVVATNSAGTATSTAATLTVKIVPVFTTQPQSQAAFVGSTVTLTAAASSTTTITYQWQKGGINIPGATGPTLTLSNVSLTDAASYAVIATDAVGSAASRFARLVVLMSQQNAITYATTVSSTGVTAGGTVNFNYFVTNVGTKTWGTNHYLSIRDSNGTFVAFSPLIGGSSPGETTAANLRFPAPTTPGTYTYYVQALENGVEFFLHPVDRHTHGFRAARQLDHVQHDDVPRQCRSRFGHYFQLQCHQHRYAALGRIPPVVPEGQQRHHAFVHAACRSRFRCQQDRQLEFHRTYNPRHVHLHRASLADRRG